jgi:hypothetical protein
MAPRLFSGRQPRFSVLRLIHVAWVPKLAQQIGWEIYLSAACKIVERDEATEAMYGFSSAA